MIRFCRKTGRFSAPYSVNISVTEKCPLRCHFCFHEYDNNKELDYKKLIGYLDEMTSLGVVQVQFSGGEPLIYPHIFDAIQYAHRKGMYVVLSSSGYGLTEEVATKLSRMGLDCCYISLNGSKSDINKITRDGYERAIKGLQACSNVGLKSAINWVAYHDNVEDLSNLIVLAKRLKVSHICVLPMKNSRLNGVVARIMNEDMNKIMEICRKSKGYVVLDSCFEELMESGKGKGCLKKGCRAGILYMAISAKGEFKGCPHENSGVMGKTIKEYWMSSVEKDGNCIDCM